jgi:hypothetical protein
LVKEILVAGGADDRHKARHDDPRLNSETNSERYKSRHFIAGNQKSS